MQIFVDINKLINDLEIISYISDGGGGYTVIGKTLIRQTEFKPFVFNTINDVIEVYVDGFGNIVIDQNLIANNAVKVLNVDSVAVTDNDDLYNKIRAL
jgi:hypothetical protein